MSGNISELNPAELLSKVKEWLKNSIEGSDLTVVSKDFDRKLELRNINILLLRFDSGKLEQNGSYWYARPTMLCRATPDELSQHEYSQLLDKYQVDEELSETSGNEIFAIGRLFVALDGMRLKEGDLSIHLRDYTEGGDHRFTRVTLYPQGFIISPATIEI